ncbi:N-acetyl-gamma-glutamyl-phosphate reductase [Devosia limi DSM 17137]|uniref:N-acetyl-gamma-glutamyl-phosphate reductase n=1 Tax=Devosia limi DSM 17137 TaxID=1121477 RepID=A0A0F5LVT8_9HYPH|nr:N-acetyl-gamma-glutamyl-phosphate reductase [Devosia limi]KKB86242.1 N-acetyl-gamma-glutamyl-phosphate reductase [Devosia limi DSM 17137]KKB86284.1 N-acetyl-gamma-glutamyl-phosphate reductase [Devosia limi DSM 17137]SHF14921.1 N-acetyl-gamma-glutamyl-phosphate reductase [Devosia limi DSM 17137]
MVAKIFIDGEAGTTGLQIRERLAGRDDLVVLSIPADKRKDIDTRAALLNQADVAILCLPDDAARESVSLITNGTTRVIDASTAYRVDPDWAYGFAEMSREQSDTIARARFVSNPGCYPQGVIATVRPLIEAGILPADFPLTVNAISGYSGGGKQMIAEYEAAGPAASHFMPYGLTFGHKHVPEMTSYSRLAHAPLFVPSVGDYAQGMVDFVPLQLGGLAKVPTGAQIHSAIAGHFAGIKDSFVTVAPYEELAKTPELDPQIYNNTNQMKLHVFANDARAQVLLVAVYDNLGKGASGAAVQNLNLMLGVDPRTSL